MSASHTVDRAAEFLLVRAVRDYTRAVGQKISDATQRDYNAKYSRMRAVGYLPEHAGTKRAYYAYRAALLYCTSHEAIAALRARDKAVYGSAQWEAAVGVLRDCHAVYNRYPPDQNKTHHETGSASFTWSDIKAQRGITGVAALTQSKKSMLPKLRPIQNWQTSLFACVTGKHRDAAAVVALTGARPSEVAQGVTVTLQDTDRGRRLLISIIGTKLSSMTGQPQRHIRLRIESDEARHLVNRLGDWRNGATFNVTTNPSNLCAAIIKAGRKAFPKLKGTVTPYVLRHALASALKKEGVDPVSLGRLLGHQATETQQYYGYAVCGAGRSSVEAVRASAPVRVTHRNPSNIIGHAKAVSPAYWPS